MGSTLMSARRQAGNLRTVSFELFRKWFSSFLCSRRRLSALSWLPMASDSSALIRSSSSYSCSSRVDVCDRCRRCGTVGVRAYIRERRGNSRNLSNSNHPVAIPASSNPLFPAAVPAALPTPRALRPAPHPSVLRVACKNSCLGMRSRPGHVTNREYHQVFSPESPRWHPSALSESGPAPSELPLLFGFYCAVDAPAAFFVCFSLPFSSSKPAAYAYDCL